MGYSMALKKHKVNRAYLLGFRDAGLLYRYRDDFSIKSILKKLLDALNASLAKAKDAVNRKVIGNCKRLVMNMVHALQKGALSVAIKAATKIYNLTKDKCYAVAHLCAKVALASLVKRRTVPREVDANGFEKVGVW